MNKDQYTRQIVLDTETTGLEVSNEHRIIEIGAVEIVNRRLTGKHYWEYLQPDRAIDDGALAVHGITPQFLKGKPRFEDVFEQFLAFIEGAEVIIHNAAFDVAFLDYELRRCSSNTRMDLSCEKITDSLALARTAYPGQRNNLDALCRRLDIDNSRRKLHGALLDAEILADVYLLLTSAQSALGLELDSGGDAEVESFAQRNPANYPPMVVVQPTPEELAEHQIWLDRLEKSADDGCVWGRMELAS